eukprot:CAMPEP_0170517698 /NCGR_PEP_ID=MMETSP0209-20121228/3596_1 /TAXON_ID=665100 ORGANISM="Litonotus pictus, Strain P1" /NCGR_SAMPLE_ID=MMETSP0209 /ASSEMBLY_ACC=CAM_ASM_000301 /LENGTH=289 /DNA_ID=CAMNT_0010803017 /DNA_START=867 /DNA_END=1736 /DNA_ORIENTATION=+
MTTVGYGDFYPLTNLGRLVIIITSFLGSALISLLTLITGNKLSLTDTEMNVYDFGNRLEARKEKEEAFSLYTNQNFKFRIRYNQLRRYVNSNPTNKLSADNKYQTLKVEILDHLYKKIEMKKDSRECFYNFRNSFEPLDDNFAIENKIKEISEKIEFMFKNFINLEKSLDFIESLENKKFAEDEKMKLLSKMNDMQKYIEQLEEIIASQKQQQEKGTHLKRKSLMSGISDKKSYHHDRSKSNMSNTKIMNNKNTDLFNIDEFGYKGNKEDEESNYKNLDNIDNISNINK